MEVIHPGMARTFFDQWFIAINAENKLPRVHDKKLTIVTLCALMELNMESIPNCLRDGWFGILGCVIKMFKELPKAIQGRLSLFFFHLIGFDLAIFGCWLARKELEQAMQEEVDTDDEGDDKFLNFADNEGKKTKRVSGHLVYGVFLDDVWDQDSAYMEVLAKEVSYTGLFFLENDSFCSKIRVLVFVNNLKIRRNVRMEIIISRTRKTTMRMRKTMMRKV